MKKSILFFLLTAVFLMCFSCHAHKKRYRMSYMGGKSNSASTGWDYSGAAGAFEQSNEFLKFTGGVPANYGDDKNFMDGKTQEGIDKKIVYNAEADLKIKKVDTVNARLKRIAEKYDGYAQSLGPRTSVIRVKAAFLNTALDEVAKLGKMKNKSVYGDDVTAEFVDLALRLDNYERTRDRYKELLAKAVGVSEILKVEKELERVTREIELLKGKLELLKNQIDYSTITVYLKERRKLGVLGYLFKGIYLGIKWLFVMN